MPQSGLTECLPQADLQAACHQSGLTALLTVCMPQGGLTGYMPQSDLTECMPQADLQTACHRSGLTLQRACHKVVLQTSMPQKWPNSMSNTPEKCAAFRSLGRLHAQAVARVLQLLHAAVAVLQHATRVVLQTCHISGLTGMPHEWSYRHAT